MIAAEPQFEIGNTEGRYFSESHFDTLKDFARTLQELCEVDTFKLWYDNQKDDHHLTFTKDGTEVDIRYYKVLSVTYNGKDGWRSCPVYCSTEFAYEIQRILKNGYSSRV